MKDNVKSYLERYSLISRKYNLKNKADYLTSFSKIDVEILENAWLHGLKEIRHEEIIKDASCNFTIEQKSIINNRSIVMMLKNHQKIYSYLNSSFEPKKLKLSDENIERRFRYNIAIKYLQLIELEIDQLRKEQLLPNKAKKIVLNAYDSIKAPISIFICILLISSPFWFSTVRDGLTSVEKLTVRIHEKSKYTFDGAICNDGWVSHSQGRGTCSWHDGVDFYFYDGEYGKSIEECRKEAIKKSWRD